VSSSIQDGKWETTLVAQFQGGISAITPAEVVKLNVQKSAAPTGAVAPPSPNQTNCQEIKQLITSQKTIEDFDPNQSDVDIVIEGILAGEFFKQIKVEDFNPFDS
jgi:hypothetical protein